MTFRIAPRGLLAALLASAVLAAPAFADPPLEGPPPAAPAASGPCPGAELMPSPENVVHLNEATLCLINVERGRRGLKPLTANSHLTKAAQNFSRAMVRDSFFDHVSPGGSTLLSRVRRGTGYLRGARRYALGENIAWGSGEFATPGQTVQGWMDSSGHRANILNKRFRHIGVGIANGAPEDAQGMPAATYTTDFGYRS